MTEVNMELVGHEFPPSAPYLVGREKVREFARAVLATHPMHFDVEAARAAGYADIVAPPTFTTTVGRDMGSNMRSLGEFGVDYSRIVHGEQRYNFTRPIVAGDELISTMSVIAVRAAGGHTMITTQTVLSDLAGEVVVTGTSIAVMRGEE